MHKGTFRYTKTVYVTARNRSCDQQLVALTLFPLSLRTRTVRAQDWRTSRSSLSLWRMSTTTRPTSTCPMGSSGRRILHQVPVPIILYGLRICTFCKSAILIGICAHRQFSQAAFAHNRKQQFSTSIARIIFLWMSDFSGSICPKDVPVCTLYISAAFVGLFPSFVCPISHWARIVQIYICNSQRHTRL